MTTIADAMSDATAELRQTRLALADLSGRVETQLAAKVNEARAAIEAFTKIPSIDVYCDPIEGNDAFDGLSIDKPKRSIDTIIANMGSRATQILLLSNATLRNRHTVHAPLYIAGIQRAAGGFINYRRTLGWLGLAENSPAPVVGTFCAGIWVSGPTVRLFQVDLAMPDVPSNLNYREMITSNIGCTVALGDPTITLSSQQAGFLFAANGARITVIGSPVLGSGVAGHLFSGISAGVNPNGSFNYSTNITSG